MTLPVSKWSNFLGALGLVRRNRRQRQATKHSPRRSTVRRHAFDTLEARVVLDGDELPIADSPVVDIRIRSDEQAAVVDTYGYLSLAGGYDPDGGSVSVVGGNTPPPQIALMAGQDYAWNYTLADDELNEVTGTITLRGVGNNAPIAVDDEYNIVIPYGQSTVRINLNDYGPALGNDSDPDGDDLSLISAPGGEVDVGISGYDYEYVIDDGWGGTAIGHVHIGATQDTPPNRAPNAADDEYTVTIGRDEATAWLDMSAYQPNLGNDSDPDGDPISLVDYQGPSGYETLPPGDHTWTYTITDPSGAQGSASVIVHVVNAPNQGPTAGNDDYGALVIGRDDAGATIDWSQFAPSLSNDNDPDGDPLTIESFTAPTSPEWVPVGEERSYEYTISDGHGGTATATVHLRVEAAPNQGPTAGDDDYGTILVGHNETGAMIDWSQYAPSLSNDSDPENDALEVVSFAAPTSPEWVPVGEERSYEYVISDGHGGTSTGHVRLQVANAPNQGPTAGDDVYERIIGRDESQAYVDWHLYYGPDLGNDSDPEGDELSVTSFDASTNTELLGVGTHERTYTISDGHGGTATGTVRLVIANAQNQLPTAGNDEFQVRRSGTTQVTGSVMANDSDPENDNLTVQAGPITTARGATVTMNGDGSFTYEAAPDEMEPHFVDSFTYTCDDGHGGQATATVNCVAPVLPMLTIAAEVPDTHEAAVGVFPTPGKFRVTRTGDIGQALPFQYTIRGTATNVDDYWFLIGFAEFEVGEAVEYIDVKAYADDLIEPAETVIVELSAGDDYDLGEAKEATVTIHECPTLTTPADQDHREGTTVQLQLEAGNTYGGETFDATGLPAGLTCNPTTGLISGKIGYLAADNQPAAGHYTVTAKLKDAAGVVLRQVTFQWHVVNASIGTLGLEEWHPDPAADYATQNGISVTGIVQSTLYVSPNNFVKLSVAGAELPDNLNDVLWLDSNGETGTFAANPERETVADSVTTFFVGIDVNGNGTLEQGEHEHGAKIRDLIVPGSRIGAKRVGNGPLEAEHFTLKGREQVEIGGQFEYKFFEANGSKLGELSLLRYMLVNTWGNAPPLAEGSGMEFTHTFTAEQEGLKTIRIYADANDNGAWDDAEDFEDSRSFLAQPVKVYSFNLWYSSLIGVDPTNTITDELAHGTTICLRKDSDADFRAAVKFELNGHTFQFVGNGNTEFNNGTFFTPDNITNETQEQTLFGLAPDWTIICVADDALSAGVGEDVGGNELIIDFDDHYETTLAHEIAHLAGAPADHSDGPTPDHIMYHVGNDTANLLEQKTADKFAGIPWWN